MMSSPGDTRSLGLGLLASVAGVAVTTALIYPLGKVMPVEGAVVIYLLPVLLVSANWGPVLGIVTSVLSSVAFAFFHITPTYSFSLVRGEEWVALAVFLIVALVTSILSGRARRLATEQEALRRVATQVAQARSPSDVFGSVTREVALHSGADLARMERYEADGTATVVAMWSGAEVGKLTVDGRVAPEGASIAALVRETGGPVRIDSFEDATGPIADEARALGIASSVGCPIVVQGRVWGVMAASSKSGKSFRANTEAEIAEFTELVATAIANAESRDELIASRARVVAAGDEARRRIQRDLHDGAQQRLVNATITLKMARARLGDGDPEADAALSEALDHVERATKELRDLSHGLLPSVLVWGGLRAAVQSLVAQISLPVEVQVCKKRFPPSIEATAYFLVSEALTNAVKHAKAEKAGVRAEDSDSLLQIEVRDDGAGGADLAGGSGLVGLQDRVAALEGTLEVVSPAGQGTRVRAMLPLRDGREPR